MAVPEPSLSWFSKGKKWLMAVKVNNENYELSLLRT